MHLPSESLVVSTFWAFDSYRGQSSQLLFFLSNYGNSFLKRFWVFDSQRDDGFLVAVCFLLVAAFWANPNHVLLFSLCHQPFSTLGTELHDFSPHPFSSRHTRLLKVFSSWSGVRARCPDRSLVVPLIQRQLNGLLVVLREHCCGLQCPSRSSGLHLCLRL